MKYVSVEEMVAIEKEADASGLSYEQMMENAGAGLAETVTEVYGDLLPGGVLGLVGSGNNGGDTLVALAHLAREGARTAAYLVRPRPVDDPLLERLKEAGGEVVALEEDGAWERLSALLGEHTLLLDGVLGTGIRLPLQGPVAEALNAVNRLLGVMEDPPVVIAVDVPSGVDSNTGEAAAEAIPADLTVTMAAVKQGLLKFPAHDLVGDLRLVSIGLPEEGEGTAAWQAVRRFVVSRRWTAEHLPLRRDDAHKGTFGTAVIAGGSLSYTGAALLAGKAAYRSGAGLVTLAVPRPLHPALAGHIPEATWILLESADGAIAAEAAGTLRKNMERATALLLGPGFGMLDSTGSFLARLLGGRHTAAGRMGFFPAAEGEARPEENGPLPPLVIDADGLKLLAKIPDWPSQLPAPAVLTPHPGEMAVLTGLTVEEIQAERVQMAERFSQEWGHVVVLKGAFTVVAAPDGQTAVIPVASAALARAGTGDVLAGLITGLRAQGMEAFPAAVAGAWIHAQAGLLAAEALGNSAAVLAGDLLPAIPEILADLGV
jgi:ADP-dependent NAD(P)H-hydrate dehydratase / NAD(P)H-hydrate epimerase